MIPNPATIVADMSFPATNQASSLTRMLGITCHRCNEPGKYRIGKGVEQACEWHAPAATNLFRRLAHLVMLRGHARRREREKEKWL